MVVHPPFAWQLGTLTFILSLALQLALVVLSSCGCLYYYVDQSPRDEVTPLGSSLYQYSIGTKAPLNLCYLWGNASLCDGVTLTGRDCFRSQVLDWNEDSCYPLGFWLVQGLRDGVTLLGRVCVVGLLTRSKRRLILYIYSLILRDGVTLWVKCDPRYTLDRNEGCFGWLANFLQDGVTLFRVRLLAT